MGAVSTPVLLALAVTVAGQTKTFTQQMGSVAVRNSGPNVASMAIGGTPPLVAGFADGQYQLQVNESVNFSLSLIGALSFKCAAGTASIEFIVSPSGGGTIL